MTAGPDQPTPDPVRWTGIRRVLAVRLDNLGDLLMTTPALAAIRESLPDAVITLLASPGTVKAAQHLPMVDGVIGFAAPWVRHAPDETGTWVPGRWHLSGRPAAREAVRAERALLERLADDAYDAAVIFTVCTQSALPAALLCRLAGIPRRLAHARENPYELLTDWVPERDSVQAGAGHAAAGESARHEVRRQLDLVGAVGLRCADERLRFAVHEPDRQQLQARLQAVGIPADAPIVVMHPGATAASRRWPAAQFGLAARLLAARGCTVVFTGTADEMPLARTALAAAAAAPGAGLPPAVSLAGCLTLGELAALLERARVLVSNNSAPVHLAAAIGTPVVDLYALTNPQHTPWGTPSRVLFHDVPCRWCLRSVCPEHHHDCLRGVSAGDVADAALELMARCGGLPASAPALASVSVPVVRRTAVAVPGAPDDLAAPTAAARVHPPGAAAASIPAGPAPAEPSPENTA